jgi:hypothetical protein
MAKPATILICLLFYLVACAPAVRVSPQPGIHDTVSHIVCGEVEYTGNKKYLPQTVCQSNHNPGLIVRFSHDVNYGNSSTKNDMILSLIPTTALGTPVGEDTTAAFAELEIIKNGTCIKKYSAACTINTHRTLFSGAANYTESRDKALIEVRKSIESQMLADKALLESVK